MRKSPVPSDQLLDIDLRKFLFSYRAIFMPWLRAFRHFHLGLAFLIAHLGINQCRQNHSRGCRLLVSLRSVGCNDRATDKEFGRGIR